MAEAAEAVPGAVEGVTEGTEAEEEMEDKAKEPATKGSLTNEEQEEAMRCAWDEDVELDMPPEMGAANAVVGEEKGTTMVMNDASDSGGGGGSGGEGRSGGGRAAMAVNAVSSSEETFVVIHISSGTPLGNDYFKLCVRLPFNLTRDTGAEFVRIIMAHITTLRDRAATAVGQQEMKKSLELNVETFTINGVHLNADNYDLKRWSLAQLGFFL